MASNPGLLTDWPWKKLGNLKYGLVLPLMAHTIYNFISEKKTGRDIDYFKLSIIPMQVLRILHTQLWISVSRFQTARSKHRIVNKSIDFEQVDRERNWDDQVILTALLLHLSSIVIPSVSSLPWWNTKGFFITVFLHAGPVEFLYYWFHRALHHHYLYSRYHSHHHSSIVTEPITSVIHPFAEEVVYFLLFAIPLTVIAFTGTASIIVAFGYQIYIDFMNFMGHCNFELVPKSLFDVFPPLKYLMYTPTFHSLHHTQFRTNYSLFMPFYDYIYGTVDRSSDDLYEKVLKGKEPKPDVVHLTHPTTLVSLYQLRLGFASLASVPYGSTWYTLLTWPLTWMSLLLTWVCGSAFTIERNKIEKLELQTWAIPRFTFQYKLPWQKHAINGMIEKAITEAEKQGTKVVSLGLLNQDEELNNNGEIYIRKNPNMKVRLTDGTSLAVAVVMNNIPDGTKQVLIRGKITKVAHLVANALCRRGIQVIVVQRSEFEALKVQMPANISNQLVFSNNYSPNVWLVGDGLKEEEQKKATKGTTFIPFSQFPHNLSRKDCIYHATPSLTIPKSFENMHACENWLPRRVMSAWRVAGIVHALEGWETHEIGDSAVLNSDDVWRAATSHGFAPVAPTMGYHARW